MTARFVSSCAGLLLLCLAVQLPAGELPAGVMPVAGIEAPPLQLDNLDGVAYDLADSGGHWRFVHFWASWCGPCRREMPSIQKMLPLIEGTDIEVVLVNTAETEDEVFTFLGIVAPDLVPLLDTDGLVTQAWQPRGLPSTYLVDPGGRIRYQVLGGREWEKPAYVEFLRGLAR
ncbi:MAG: TlpA family protein disulfide reductase [Gammaproteobacteria bacterium]|nr:TlpA family protein disulfide reductase [Gammaproteobacteria bacterium]MDH5514460.1 TlpA family protein disulfide reductase [Gammaproteobacteria bacterium]